MACKNGVCSRSRGNQQQGMMNPQQLSPVVAGQQGGIQIPNQVTTPSQQYSKKKGGFWKGNPGYNMVTTPYTPNQQGIMNWLAQSGQEGLQGMGNQGFDFGPIAQQAQSQFYNETVPTLAERFTAMGNGQRSSAFESAIGRAGAGMQENLAALKAQYDYGNQQNQQNHFMNRIQAGLRPQYENAYVPSTGGFLQSAGAGVAKAAPYVAAAFL